MKVEVRKLKESAQLPTRGTRFSAGADLHACLDAPVQIQPGQTALIGTGLAAAIPEGYFGAVFARSGLATKEGLRPANCVGVIDSDYRGEFKVPLHNDSDQVRTITQGERIAQLILVPYLDTEYVETDQLDQTERGEGGFGHTGKH